MDRLRVRRTISIVIEGDMNRVHDVASRASIALPSFDSDPAVGFRYRIEQREDVLDGNGEVIPAVDIVKAVREVGGRTGGE